ncbi:MAG: hypothetical protein QXY39_08645 [Thermofilaceae archaeon]
MSTAIGRLAKYFSPAPRKPLDFVVNVIVDDVREAREHRRFVDVLIMGLQGVGKSTLALLTMYKYYDYDAERVLNNVFFSSEDLIEDLTVIKRELVLLDDAGVSLTKYRAMAREAVDFVIFLNPIRTRLSGLLYTTVHDNLVRFARETAKYLIVLQEPLGAKTPGVLWKTITTKHGRLYKKEVCNFIMDLKKLHQDPDFHRLYTEYNTMREQFTVNVNQRLLERIKGRKKTL